MTVRNLPIRRIADARTRRLERHTSLAAWAPWGPLAPRRLLRERPGERFALRYLVRHSADMQVERKEGEPVGRVERLVIAPFDFWPVELVVRTPAGEEVRIPAGCVCAAEPVEGRLIIRGMQSVRGGSS